MCCCSCCCCCCCSSSCCCCQWLCRKSLLVGSSCGCAARDNPRSSQGFFPEALKMMQRFGATNHNFGAHTSSCAQGCARKNVVPTARSCAYLPHRRRKHRKHKENVQGPLRSASHTIGLCKNLIRMLWLFWLLVLFLEARSVTAAPCSCTKLVQRIVQNSGEIWHLGSRFPRLG